MRHSFPLLFALLFLLNVVTGGPNSQDIIHLLQGGVSEETIRAWIETQRDFKLTKEEIQELQQAGASAGLITWLRTTGRAPQESDFATAPEHPAPLETPDPSTPFPTPSFSVEVQLINIVATVKDKKGNPVKDLNREDFVVYEDGQLQQITNFSAGIRGRNRTGS